MTSERSTEQEEFYSKAEEYWATVSPTDEGMLGGQDSVDPIEIQSSRLFLSKIQDLVGLRSFNRALDCGAGIGRVTKKLLLPLFGIVDMAEITPHFLEEAKSYIGEPDFSRVGKQFCCGLQDLQFSSDIVYDVVWVQWVIGHLTDDDFVHFLKQAVKSLSSNGVLVIKDNVIHDRPDDDSDYDYDATDSSYCRPRLCLLRLFTKAGLKVIAEEIQADFPSHLYPVFMFALVPKTRKL